MTLKMKPSKEPDKDLVLPGVAKEIKTKTKALDPKKGSKFYIFTEEEYKIDQWGPWTLTAPDAYKEESTLVGVQVTTGLPMEGTSPLSRWRLMYLRDFFTNYTAISSNPRVHLDLDTESLRSSRTGYEA